MTINELIRELLSIPKVERMKNMPWGPTIRIKTKNSHEIQVTALEEFIEPYQEIPIEFEVIQPQQISEKIN